jgi:BrnA antitoxin of type II toxin-antitoxin system
MRKQIDFSYVSGAKRAKDVPHLAKLQARAKPNKARVTMWIDDDVAAAFRERTTQGRDRAGS